jgi:hypothetical protein
VLYLGKTRNEEDQLSLLRNYHSAFVQNLTDALYAHEKANKYGTNLFGIAFQFMFMVRHRETDAYIKNEDTKKAQMARQEKELLDLFKQRQEQTNKVREEHRRDAVLRKLKEDLEQLKKREAMDKSFQRARTPSPKQKFSKPIPDVNQPHPKAKGRPHVKISEPPQTEPKDPAGRTAYRTSPLAKPCIKPTRPSKQKEAEKPKTKKKSKGRPDKPSSSDSSPSSSGNSDCDSDFEEEDFLKTPKHSKKEHKHQEHRSRRGSQRGSPYRHSSAGSAYDESPHCGAGKPSPAPSASGPFPKFGKVSSDPSGISRRRKEVPPPKTNEERLSEIIRAMASNGIQPGYYTESNLTSAALIMKFMDEYQKNRKILEAKAEIENVDLSNQDLSVQSFDFNLYGTTPEDILGPRFMNTVFVNDVSRTETMRAILQHMVNHPECQHPTKGIILGMLGSFDISRQNKANMANMALSNLQTMGAISSPCTTGVGDDLLILPPVLGTKSSYGTHLSKGVFSALGLSIDDKFCLENPDSKPLNLYLPSLKRIIEAEQLCSDSAFTLLLSVLKGDCFDEVHTQLREGDKTFEEIWMSLQKTSGRALHTGGLEKVIQDILHKPPSCVPAALSRIQNLRTKMNLHIPNKAIRQMKTSDAIYHDFRQLIRTHLPLESVPIDWAFRNKRSAHEEEVKLRQLQGLPALKPFDQAQVYKEIVCSYLASEVGSSPFPQVILQNSSSLPKKLTISEAELKPILKTSSAPEEGQEHSAPSTHSESGHDRGRTQVRSQGSNRSNNSRSESGRSRSYDPNNQRTGYNNYSNNNSRDNSRPRMHIPEMAANMLGERTCYLCKQSGHHSYHCTLYPNEPIRDGPPCPRCGAFHSSKCKAQMRTEIDQPLFIKEDGSRIPYAQQPYIPGPNDQQQRTFRPPFQNQNPRYPNNQGRPSYGPVPWNQNPRRRTTNFNGSPNYTSNPRLFDAYSDRRPARAGPPRDGNYRNGANYQNNQGPPPQGDYQNQNNQQPPKSDNQSYMPNPEYQRNQQPMDGAIGNAGAQRPPANVFINSAQMQSHPSSSMRETQDARYQDHHSQGHDQRHHDEYDRSQGYSYSTQGGHHSN